MKLSQLPKITAIPNRDADYALVNVGDAANKEISITNLMSPVVSKGPAIVNSGFVGTVTAAASTTVTFSSEADAILAGYHATAPVLGVTLKSNDLTRYIQSWNSATECVVDSAVTWAGTAITSVQGPIAVFVDSSGAVKGYMLASGVVYFVGNVGFKTPTPGDAVHVAGGIRLGVAGTSQSLSVYLGGGVDAYPLVNNAYVVSGVGWKYLGNGPASMFYYLAGKLYYATAPVNSSGAGASLAAWTTRIVFDENGNVGFSTATFGTSATNTTGVAEGTDATTSPANMAQMVVKNVGGVADKCAFHMRDEAGNNGPIGFSNILEVAFPSTGTMAANNVYGVRHTNYGQTDDAIMTFLAAAAGQGGSINMATTVAKYFRLTPPSGTFFLLDGAPLSVDQSVQVASAALGQRIDWDVIQTGAATWQIQLWTVSGPWAGV